VLSGVKVHCRWTTRARFTLAKPVLADIAP
jgi:hypothetical protein